MMTFMRGEPLVAKMATLARFVVLPGAMVAALVYSPPDYAKSDKPAKHLPPISGFGTS